MRIAIILFLLAIGLYSQAQQNSIEEINRLYNYYCDNKLFTNASNLLVDKGNECLDRGDTLSAYVLQLENCHLTDEHLEEFFNHGLTWEGYFSNWYVTISIAAWLKKKDEVVPELLRVLDLVSQKEPKLLPFYASTLGYLLYDYKDIQKEHSIYVLQKALDYIISVPPSHELVKQFNKIIECFYINRYYNTFDGHTMYSNKINECDVWFNKYRWYIDSLEPTIYKKDIVNYYVQHTDNLYMTASTLSAQHNNPEQSILLLSKSVEYLTKIKNLNDSIPIKIASFYSEIAKDFFQLGDNIKVKEYCDKAYDCLFQVRKNLDYCSVLSSIALNYWNINQPKLAASLKKKEILLREETPMPPSCSDYALYMMYNQEDTISTLVLGSELEKKYNYTESSMIPVYNYMSDAFSKMMHKAMCKGDSESASFYKERYEQYVSKTKDAINFHKNHLDKYQLTSNTLGAMYSTISSHCARIGNFEDSFIYAEKALEIRKTKSLYDVSLKSAAIHKKEAIHKYLPQYYQSLEYDINKMLPLLGSLESDYYLMQGAHPLYKIPEWASWNPTDSICISIAYDAALLMKGLTLRYSVLSPYYDSHPVIVGLKLELDKMRDSIYTISNDDARLLALHRYELKEREMLKDVNGELTKVHWKDILYSLKKDEACIEFVKYTANAYLWCDGLPQNHYAALVLLGDGESPIFVDLFDEQDIFETYRLQPKSYETKTGYELYDKIWGKLSNYIANKSQVYFSPMGMLNLINIEALIDMSGHTALETYNLKRVSSTRQLVSPAKENQIRSVISYGGIDYAEISSEIIDSLNTRGNWNYLKNTLTEVRNIQETLQKRNKSVTTIIGSNATETSFKNLNGTTASIIHIASHGFYIPLQLRETIPFYGKSNYTQKIRDELFYSGLIMSGGQTTWTNSSFEVEKDDGILTSYEISKIDLHNVDLVVLSACETGLGDNHFDGIFGLQRAFKKAGAKSILMSLWKIDDMTTSEYMSLFYNHLSSGLSKHDSYRRTVAEMKKKYLDPYYWASFIMLD